MSNKQSYRTPELSVYGSVEKITLQGGGNKTDVPIGTPATNIDDITS